MPSQSKQLSLDPELEEALVLQKAREMYTRSRYLSGRYASFARLMADPLAARCLRLCATQVVRLGQGKQTRGR